ncbi:MAG: DUF4198 domain-containing protein [Deltaproteobacteria bacterium]|jgi:uncharacterized GH25 family protein|nr:DUF4198 domain-containing protein [Deltaproteobacteria bacterium]
MRKSSLFALVFAFVMASGALSAHDLWVTADKPEAGKVFPLIVGYGHDYPSWEAIPEEEYGLFKVKLLGPGGEIPLTAATPNYKWNSAGPAEAGAYVMVADAAPVFWTRTPDGWSMKPRNETPGATSCGRFIEGAKGITAVGNAGARENVTKPVGLPLEIVPGADPTGIKPGSPLPLTVLLIGKPLPSARIFARYAGFDKIAKSTDASAFTSVTDKDGKVNFVPLVPGEWLVTVRHETPYPDPAVCDKEDYGTSLHFEVN